MILTVEGLPTHLLTRGTVSITTLLVTRMLPTVSDTFTFNITGKLSGTLDLFTLSSTFTRFSNHLEAGGTITTVTSII
jgi:glycine cleavage system regulatory protein